jgi:hypothetical protein
MAFADDGCAIGRNRNPYPGDVDGEEIAAVLPGDDTPGLQRLPAPAIMAKDAIGLGDDIPAFEIGQGPSISPLPCSDGAFVDIALEGGELLA